MFFVCVSLTSHICLLLGVRTDNTALMLVYLVIKMIGIVFLGVVIVALIAGALYLGINSDQGKEMVRRRKSFPC